MKRIVLVSAVLGGAAVVIGQMNVGAEVGSVPRTTVESPGDFEPTGGVPDVWVFKISGLSNWSDPGYRAYSVGTTSCNTGSGVLTWNGGTNQHPVISQGMYRLAPGAHGHPRFEMLGQSWLKHGFCALDQTECTGSCQGTGCGSLGIGCSDPYTSGRNGSQGPAGPKYQVNATTGFFPYPPASPSYSGNTARRLRVHEEDVAGGTTPDNTFFLEAMYVHPQDSPATTDNAGNNASYREVTLNSSGVASAYVGLTVVQKPAIQAWVENDPQVTLSIEKITGEGDVHIAHRVYDNLDGTWDYEYAVYNMNLDRSIRSFRIPVPDSVTVTNVGFRDVDYHSGDGEGNQNFDGTDWPSAHASGRLSWATDSFADNTSANAIRWGTMYNFRYTANTPPQNVSATLELFKPGSPNAISTTVAAPQPCTEDCGPACPEDLDGSGEVGFSDILQIIGTWGPCVGCPEDLNGNDQVDFADILAVIAAWGACP